MNGRDVAILLGASNVGKGKPPAGDVHCGLWQPHSSLNSRFYRNQPDDGLVGKDKA